MSISLFYHSSNTSYLMLAAGFESGYVCLFGKDTKAVDHLTSSWQLLYIHKTHSHPGMFRDKILLLIALSLSLLQCPRFLLIHTGSAIHICSPLCDTIYEHQIHLLFCR